MRPLAQLAGPLIGASLIAAMATGAACDEPPTTSGEPSARPTPTSGPPPAPARLWLVNLAAAASPVAFRATGFRVDLAYGEGTAASVPEPSEPIRVGPLAGGAGPVAIPVGHEELVVIVDAEGPPVETISSPFPEPVTGQTLLVLVSTLRHRAVAICVEDTSHLVRARSIRDAEPVAPGRPFHVSVHAADAGGGCGGEALAHGTMNPSEGVVALIAAAAPGGGAAALYACERTIATPTLGCRILP